MTQQQFQEQYASYRTQSREEAEAECRKVNVAMGSEQVVVREFPPFGFCLMLRRASDLLGQFGI